MGLSGASPPELEVVNQFQRGASPTKLGAVALLLVAGLWPSEGAEPEVRATLVDLAGRVLDEVLVPQPWVNGSTAGGLVFNAGARVYLATSNGALHGCLGPEGLRSTELEALEPFRNEAVDFVTR